MLFLYMWMLLLASDKYQLLEIKTHSKERNANKNGYGSKTCDLYPPPAIQIMFSSKVS